MSRRSYNGDDEILAAEWAEFEKDDYAVINGDGLLAALAAGDEGSVATCDLCGASDDHTHPAKDYGTACDECGALTCNGVDCIGYER